MLKEYTLRDLITIKNGKKYLDLSSDGKTPVYGSGGVMGFTSTEGLYDGEAILLPRKGSIANILYVKNSFWTVDTMYYALIKSGDANAYYISNYLKQLDLSRLNSGSGVPSMTFDAYYDIKLSLPSIKEQEKVADLIYKINGIIALNNRSNDEMEKLLRHIFKYWFVQFDFDNEEGDPYKSSGGMMQYDEQIKRDIPKGWSTQSVKNLMRESKNGDWGKDKQENDNTKVFCIRGADIDALNGQSDKLEPPIRYIEKNHLNRLLKPHDLIIEISGGSPTQSTGRIAHIGENVFNRFQEPIVCSNFCKAITLKNSKIAYLVKLYWNILFESGVFFNFEGKTSGIKNLLFDQLVKEIYIPLPDNEGLINEFYSISKEIDAKIQNNLLQNMELIELRDWLLPLLMTRQIAVGE